MDAGGGVETDEEINHCAEGLAMGAGAGTNRGEKEKKSSRRPG